MGSDAENLAPAAERNLLPIRRLSTLIPLRKASRNRFAFQESNYHIQADRYIQDTSPAANTFHTLAEPQVWPPKHLRLRTEETPRKDSPKNMAIFSTPQPAPPIRFPISPPPEDELRKAQTSSGSSRKRVRSISRSALPSPNPKAKKLPKLHSTDVKAAVSHERDFDDWIVSSKTKKTPSGGKSSLNHSEPRQSRPSVRTPREDGSYSTSKADRRASTASNKHTPSNKTHKRSSPPPSKSRSRPSAARSQSKTPSRSRASYSFSQSRPVTPSRSYTPPPPIESLPAPAPPSPSDDPLLLAGVPPSRRKKSTKSLPRRDKEEKRRHREISPSPAQRHYSPALELSGLGDTTQDNVVFDASFADTSGQWEEPEVPVGTDYVVPLNFGSSVSSSSAKKPSSAAGSPYPNTVVGRLDDGTPITRRQHFTMRSPSREASLAMRMAASTSPKANEVRRSPEAIQYLPDASFGFGGHDESAQVEDDQGPWEQAEEPVGDMTVSELVHNPAPAQQESEVQEQDQSTHEANPTPPSSSPRETTFSHGKRLSERFAELEKKLAQEGRSFRFSEIGAMPSSDGVGAGFERNIKFPDLPSSSVSPEKLVLQASSSPEKNIQEGEDDESRSVNDEEPEETEPERSLMQMAEEPQEESFQVDGEEVEFSAAGAEQQTAPSDLLEVKADVPIERSSSPESEVAPAVEEAPQDHQEETEMPEPTMDEDSAMQATYESSGPQDVQDASFISPIGRETSPIPSEVEEEYETSLKEDNPAINSTFEQEPLINSTFEQDSIVPRDIDDEVKGKPSVASEVAAVSQDVQEEDMEEEIDEEEELAGPSWEDETDAEPLVQIRSNDPGAAARAAAILNLHHEYVQGTPKRRESSVANSSRRRSTSRMSTPATEARIRYSQLLATPSRKGGDMSQLIATPIVEEQREEPPPPTMSVWTKHEWRCLEQCFTDVRFEVAEALGEPDIDPEEIELDDVVGRFVDTYAQGRELEGEWDWDKIHRRSMALINRQRDGTARGLRSTVTSPAQTNSTPIRPSFATPAIRILPPSSSVQTPQYSHIQSSRVAPSTAFSTPKTNYSSRTYTSNAMPPPPTIPVRSSKATTSRFQPPLPHPSKPYQIPSATPLGPSVKSVPEPSSATKRVWNWMGSFLRGGSEAPSETATRREFIPILPPITDADREALRPVSPPRPKQKERIIPPKEQVQLQHVPTPVPVREPRKLSYKTSSGSVKDMIRSFESLSDTLDNSRSQPSKSFVVKKTSNGSLSAKSFDMWKDISADVSRDQSVSQDISVSSVRSQKSFEGTGFNRGRWRL